MSAVTPIRPVELRPTRLAGVRIIGVALRCSSCGFEWRGDLDPFLAVIPETARCPRCPTEPPRAA
jgi:predicted Zn-ribbon and HTH transcriptional regulator